MGSSFNLITVIFLLGAVQGIFLSILLLNQHRNKSANRYLAALMLVYSVFIAESSIAGTQITKLFPHLLGLAAGAIFLVGPLHYFYARSLIENSSLSLFKRHFIHLVPFFGFYLYYLFPYYLKSGDYKTEYIHTLAVEGQPVSLVIFNWLAVIQGIVYMTATLVFLKKYSQGIKEKFSNIDRINLNWLKVITVMTLIVWIMGFVIKFSELFGHMPPIDELIPVSIAFLVYAMGYIGFRQPEIFSGLPEAKGNKKYERSSLTEEKARAILEKLLRLMEQDKPYTDSDLKLSRLASMISVTPNHLSQVVNDTLQQNFFDFVNSYRIDEAKTLMFDPKQQQFTLLAIAYEVGFNSKSAFYSAFKKHTGMTPTQFKKEHSA